MADSERPYLKLVRNPAPLGGYVRPLERDYRHTARLISAGYPAGTGIIVDACHPAQSADLRMQAREKAVEITQFL